MSFPAQKALPEASGGKQDRVEETKSSPETDSEGETLPARLR